MSSELAGRGGCHSGCRDGDWCRGDKGSDGAARSRIKGGGKGLRLRLDVRESDNGDGARDALGVVHRGAGGGLGGCDLGESKKDEVRGLEEGGGGRGTVESKRLLRDVIWSWYVKYRKEVLVGSLLTVHIVIT